MLIMSLSMSIALAQDKEEISLKKLDRISKSVNTLKGKETIKVGEYIQVSEDVHGSVGTTVSCYEQGDGLELVRTAFEYENDSKSHLSGGDAGFKTFYFKALKKGTYKIIVKKYFRGDLQSEYDIDITVE